VFQRSGGTRYREQQRWLSLRNGNSAFRLMFLGWLLINLDSALRPGSCRPNVNSREEPFEQRNARLERAVKNLIQWFPVGKVDTIHEVHYDLGTIAGEHRVVFHNALKSRLDEVIRLARFEIHVESVRVFRL